MVCNPPILYEPTVPCRLSRYERHGEREMTLGNDFPHPSRMMGWWRSIDAHRRLADLDRTTAHSVSVHAPR